MQNLDSKPNKYGSQGLPTCQQMGFQTGVTAYFRIEINLNDGHRTRTDP
jgi:hypothetical protein